MIQDVLEIMTPETEAGKFVDKAYRDASVRESVRIGMPYQIRALRQQRGWSQRELGTRSNKPQNVISRLEDPSYGKLSLQTLFELASTFDVALLVKFVPFSRFRTEFLDLSPERLGALGFEDDLAKVKQNKDALRSNLKELTKQLEERTSFNSRISRIHVPAGSVITSRPRSVSSTQGGVSSQLELIPTQPPAQPLATVIRIDRYRQRQKQNPTSRHFRKRARTA